MARQPSRKTMKRNYPRSRPGESLFDSFEGNPFDDFEGYPDGWPGVNGGYVPPERRVLDTTPKIFDELARREKFTPDFNKLRLKQNILVFVYDDFRIRGGFNPVLNDSKYLGFAISATDLYVLKGHRLPVLLDTTKKADLKGRIKGEVYAVPPETLLRMDKIRHNGNLFKRIERTFFLTDQKYKTKNGTSIPSVKAFVYMGIPEQWQGDHLDVQSRFSYAGSKEKKYFEWFPTGTYPELHIG